MENNKINFFVPVTFQKGKDKEGNEVMKIGGIASTPDKDSDDEYLDPKGFDLSSFLKSGHFNWNHAAKDNPAAIVGEPTSAEVTPEGLYVEGVLYNNSPVAKSIYDLASTLEKAGSKRRLGFSIEGQAVERDPKNKKKITKARITGCAITHVPKNPNTLMSIMKGEDAYIEPEFDQEEITKIISKNEDSEKNIAKNFGNDENITIFKKKLSKSQVYHEIFYQVPGLENESAKSVYNFIEQFQIKNEDTMENITAEKINKALEVLNVLADIKVDTLKKGEEAAEVKKEEVKAEAGATETKKEEVKVEAAATEVKVEAKVETEKAKTADIVKSEKTDFSEITNLIKGQSDDLNTKFAALGELNKAIIIENSELKKSLSDLSDRLTTVEKQTPERKSIQTQSFVKKDEDRLVKSESADGLKQLSITDPRDKKEIIKALSNSISWQSTDKKEIELLGKISKFEVDNSNISMDIVNKAKELGIKMVK